MITSTAFFRQSLFPQEYQEHNLNLSSSDHLTPWGLHESNPIQFTTRSNFPQRVIKIKTSRQPSKTDLPIPTQKIAIQYILPSKATIPTTLQEGVPSLPPLISRFEVKKSLTSLGQTTFRSERYNSKRSYQQISINEFIRQQRGRDEREEGRKEEKSVGMKGDGSNFLMSRKARKGVGKQKPSGVELKKQILGHLPPQNAYQLPIVFAKNYKEIAYHRDIFKYRPIRQNRFNA